jgi:DNA-binding transcriptional LysR family regulator
MTTVISIIPPGEMLFVLARRGRADKNKIFSDIKKMQGVDPGHLRILAMRTLVDGLVPGFLAQMAASYPRLGIDVGMRDGAVVASEGGKRDIVLAFNLPPQRGLQRELHTTRRVPVGSPFRARRALQHLWFRGKVSVVAARYRL